MRPFQSLLISCWFAWAATHSIAAPPPQLAEKARLDIIASDSVGALKDARLVQGTGNADRMNWLDRSKQPLTITTEFAIWPYGWRAFELRFTPEKDGTVNLDLLGPWHQVGNEFVKKEVYWDGLEASGAELTNGSFEVGKVDSPQGWNLQGGIVESSSEKTTGHDGKRIARTWHNGRLATTLKVTAGKPVVIRGHARAVIPAGLVEMKRIESRDTAAHRAARRFLRGVNFGNHLEVPPGQDWGTRYSASDVAQVKQEGFDHIRIPVGWHHYTGPGPDFAIRRAIFQRADPLVEEALKLDLNVILNIHHFEEFTSNPGKERNRFLAIWRQLSEHYAGQSERLAFELLNEPKDAATTEVLNPINAECIRIIRDQNPQRTIFVGPGLWNAIDELPKLHLPENDTNIIVTVHTYAPMNFTHQGANWSGPDFLLSGIQFPGPPPKPLRIPEAIKPRQHVLDWIARYETLPESENPSSPRAFSGSLEQARQWSEYFGRPIHVGEFGAIDRADSESRARYCRAIREQLEPHGIGWALWDWKARFRYWDIGANRPTPGMREALFGKLD